jgi:hypothetical protein
LVSYQAFSRKSFFPQDCSGIVNDKRDLHADFGDVLEKQINVTVSAKTFATMQDIRRENKLTTPELTRGLLDRACMFFERWGWFGFPAIVIPIPTPLRMPSPRTLVGAEPPDAGIAPMPHPDLAKYSWEDLVHELARRQKIMQADAAESYRHMLNESAGSSDEVAKAEQRRRKKTVG